MCETPCIYKNITSLINSALQYGCPSDIVLTDVLLTISEIQVHLTASPMPVLQLSALQFHNLALYSTQTDKLPHLSMECQSMWETDLRATLQNTSRLLVGSERVTRAKTQ
jgi:hypothetical protein